MTGGVGSDRIIGRNGNDTLTGNLDNDTIDAGAGNEQGANEVFAGAGDDSIEGGAGNDSVDGGIGTDTAYYDRATGEVTVSLSLAKYQRTGGAGSDLLTFIEGAKGAYTMILEAFWRGDREELREL